jgi:hypothetical protein
MLSVSPVFAHLILEKFQVHIKRIFFSYVSYKASEEFNIICHISLCEF